MEEYPLSHYFYQQSPWNYLLTSPPLFNSPVLPENHVHWSQTAESHIYSVDLPGVRKEEIKVEVEDSRYLIIRTQATDQLTQPAKAFMRKFRLPGRVEIEGISADYEDGVLTVTVPRSCRRISLIVDSGFAPQSLEVVARAA